MNGGRNTTNRNISELSGEGEFVMFDLTFLLGFSIVLF